MLDETVRRGLSARLYVADVALPVKRELGLLGVEHQRTPMLALDLQGRGGFARDLQRRPPGLARGLSSGEDTVDPLVVQALVGADERAVEGRAGDASAAHLEL